MAESLSRRGVLEGHAGWVTSITTPLDPNSDIILSSSRCCIGQCQIHIRLLKHLHAALRGETGLANLSCTLLGTGTRQSWCGT